MRRFVIQEARDGKAIGEGVQFYDGSVAVGWLHHWPMSHPPQIYSTMEALQEYVENSIVTVWIVWCDTK